MLKYFRFLLEQKGRRIVDPEQEKRIPSYIFTIISLNNRTKDIIDYPGIYDILKIVLIYIDNTPLKKLVYTEVVTTIKYYKDSDNSKKIVLFIMIDLFDETIRIRPPKGSCYFMCVQSLMDMPERQSTNELIIPRLLDIFDRLVGIIRS
jgi:hypothetical protein